MGVAPSEFVYNATVARSSIRALLLVHVVTALLLATSPPAFAATTLSAEIVSWQVIGLDSNDPTGSPPEVFLVQAKVTNTGAEPATNASATLTLGTLSPNPCDPEACITLISPATYELGDLAAGATANAFWSVRVARTAAAFDTSTPVTVTAVADNAPQVTATQVDRSPAPCGTNDTPGGTLFVERLISQNRNDVLSYTVDPGVQRDDGSWEVVVGTNFTVDVVASTATEYEEISLPAVADPTGLIVPLATSFTFEQGTPSADDIYTLNAGGQVNASYTFNAGSEGTVTLSQLIYDCSGNSFHYNSDFLADSVTIHIVGAPSLPDLVLVKSSNPADEADPGETITYSIAFTNQGIVDATGVVIEDVVDPGLEAIGPLDGGSYDPATRTITWDVGTVGAGESGVVRFTAQPNPFTGGTTIRNLATATLDQTPPITSNEISLEVPPTLPVSGIASTILAILGLASIGFGRSLHLPGDATPRISRAPKER